MGPEIAHAAMDAYEEGKKCAVRGGSFSECPYLSGPDDCYIRSFHGFRDHCIPNPDCAECKGSGIRTLGGLPSDSEFRLEVSCLCNGAGSAAPEVRRPFDDSPDSRLPSDDERLALCEMIYRAFLEIRILGGVGKAAQAADLADAFHNLPTGMWRDEFSFQVFRDLYLIPYGRKYQSSGATDYVAMIDKLIAARQTRKRSGH